MQGVAKDIGTSAIEAKVAQERQARLHDSDTGSRGMGDFDFGSIASLTSIQGLSAVGRSGMSTPVSNVNMPNPPASPAFMNTGHTPYYSRYSSYLPQATEDALYAAAEGQLRRPPKVFLAPANTVRAASGSGQSAQSAPRTSAQAPAASAGVSAAQTQYGQGWNRAQSASPSAATAPVAGVATTREAAVAGTVTAAADIRVPMILSAAESGDRMCYYPEHGESESALGSRFRSTALYTRRARQR